MKPSFALPLIKWAYLATVFLVAVFFWLLAVNTAAGAEPHMRAAPQQQAAGRETQPRSPLFEALKIRASEDAARQGTGSAEGDHRGLKTAWDRERAFAGMEVLRAEIVMLNGLGGAQRELLRWNRERIKTGRPPAHLPARLCREAKLSAWCALLPATFGAAGRRKIGAAAKPANPPAIPPTENTRPNNPQNGPTKDEQQ